MKGYIKVITFLLILLISNISFSQNSLRVVTYNIQGMRPGTSHEIRIQHIIENFKTLDPDIIGLQEINATKNTTDPQNQAVTIADALSDHFGIPYYYYYQKTHEAWDNQFKEYVGIVSKYEFIDQGYFDLQPGIFPRKVVWGLFATPVGNINFFNTHLSYYSAWVNEKEIDEILNFAGVKMAIQGNNNAIIVGDFNATPDTPSYSKMMNANYTDTYKTINPNLDGFTAPYPYPSIRIDYIFVTSYSDLVIDDSYCIMQNPINQDLYCSDHLGIMTTFSNPLISIKDEINGQIPNNFQIGQNFPNPFNPSTTIHYNLPEESDVSIAIYALQGKKVEQILSSTQPAGAHSIQWNGTDQQGKQVSAGIYFFQLKAGDFVQTKKMLLIK